MFIQVLYNTSTGFSTSLLTEIADVKPDNILINYSTGPNRFSEVQLGDCGDAFIIDPGASPFEEGHIIGVAIFRSPEAMLFLRWRTPTDIWSFGATVRTYKSPISILYFLTFLS